MYLWSQLDHVEHVEPGYVEGDGLEGVQGAQHGQPLVYGRGVPHLEDVPGDGDRGQAREDPPEVDVEECWPWRLAEGQAGELQLGGVWDCGERLDHFGLLPVVVLEAGQAGQAGQQLESLQGSQLAGVQDQGAEALQLEEGLEGLLVKTCPGDVQVEERRTEEVLQQVPRVSGTGEDLGTGPDSQRPEVRKTGDLPQDLMNFLRQLLTDINSEVKCLKVVTVDCVGDV